MTSQFCPCGSNLPFGKCCLITINENQPAETAEQLMRSRYRAYVKCELNYLLTTWHSSTRPNNLDLNSFKASNWNQLYIIKTIQGLKQDNVGSVEFVAYFKNNNSNNISIEKLHEVSQFVKEDNNWFYLDGKIITNSNFQPGRNSPCYCGSGKKYKQCCL